MISQIASCSGHDVLNASPHVSIALHVERLSIDEKHHVLTGPLTRQEKPARN